MSDTLSKTDGATESSREDVRRMVTIEVGQRLRLAREEQQMSLASVTEQIKLRSVQLEALESGDWQALPNETLALAFLRQYAAHLNVDIEDTLQQLKSDALSFHQPLTFPDPAIAPSKKWAIAATLLFVLLLLFWNLFGSSTDDSPSVVTPSPSIAPLSPIVSSPSIAIEQSPSAAVAIKTEPVTTKVKAEEVKPAPIEVVRSQPKLPLPLPVKKVASQPVAVAPVVAQAAAVVAMKAVANRSPQPLSHSEKAKGVPVEAAVHEFSFQADKERVWLLLEIPDGQGGRKPLREVIIRPHHSIEVTRKSAPLFVSVGNAGAIKITYEGKTLYDYGKFGPRGMVIRHRKVEVPSERTTETLSQ